MIRAAAMLACLAVPAGAADFEFCWIGSSGFAFEGRMSVPDAALSKPRITQEDVTAFAISGTLDGLPIGGWSLADLTPQTSWHLNFDPVRMVFPTGGSTYGPDGQQWNASGSVNNCGDPGFGFNSGNGGQDVCVNNTYRIESIIPRDTPFPVYLASEGPACTSTPLLGGLMSAQRDAS